MAEGANRPLTLGEKIRRLRKCKGVDREEFAKRIAVDYSTVSRYEKAGEHLPPKKLRVIATVLEVPQGYLLGDDHPDWVHRTPEQVAAFESLRLFLGRLDGEPRRRAERYLKAVDLPAAPKSVAAWEELERFLRVAAGGKP